MKIIYRKDEIVRRSEGNTVLHLGFVQHSNLWRKKIEENDWLHSQISKVAKKIVGIDFLKEEVDIIQEELGYEVYFGDVMQLSEVEIDEKFDLIICGELIEHIENAGLMLDGIKRFMHKESQLIITTPNPWRKLWVDKIYEQKDETNWLNKEHVSWYSHQTLKQLLERKNYEEVLYGYYRSESESIAPSGGLRSKLKRLFSRYHIIKDSEGLFFVTKLK